MVILFEQFAELLDLELGRSAKPRLLFVIAGHNGAGKTTCYRAYLAGHLPVSLEHHINPDDIEKEIREAWFGSKLSGEEYSELARHEADQRRRDLLNGDVSFGFETVGSHLSKVDFIREARERGYVVALLFVGLDSPEKSKARVAIRVSRGGHNVPEDRILARYPRVLQCMYRGVREASLALIVDNSADSDPDCPEYRPLAIFHHGVAVASCQDIPEWANTLTLTT